MRQPESTGFAGFFAKQSGEEREHAEKLMNHVHNRGAAPELAAIVAPKQNFKSLLEVVEQAQAMEQSNTGGINAVYEAAVAAKDYPAQVLMHWFIKEQVEEEAWAAELVDRVRAATWPAVSWTSIATSRSSLPTARKTEPVFVAAVYDRR